MKKPAAVILAAGRGVRMNSEMPKALCELSGRPMCEFLIDTARSCKADDIVVIGGYRIGLLRKMLSGHKVEIIEQRRLLGSADAVKQAGRHLNRFKGPVVVLYADTPLIKPATIKRMLKLQAASASSATILSVKRKDPKDYGRILRDKKGKICGIAECSDIKTQDRAPRDSLSGAYTEVNVGAYCFDSKRLFEGLKNIRKNREKGEYYLTDIIAYFYNKNYPVSSYITSDIDETLGINKREDLTAAEEILRERVMARLLRSGVSIKDPSTTHIQEGARIARDAVIYPFVVIERDVVVGKACRVGPFAHLRRGTVLKERSSAGNFVEIVRSRLDKGSKAKHHSYLGDTVVGKDVNVGAGTITANYNGKKKNKTVIDDGAFIGSGTTIVAPVKIGRLAVTGAGSVVVKGRDVPPKTVVVGVPARVLRGEQKRKGAR